MDVKNRFYIKSEKHLDSLYESIRDNYNSIVKDVEKNGTNKYKEGFVDSFLVRINWKMAVYYDEDKIPKIIEDEDNDD